ncbi:diaminopimelate decarboxylase [Candidatus Micrarchaeota archaeon CG10_big_fil_rev_8_21_14_0_10_45_29]|nr:MAG: diaminopimelate decarboxylase [Candidatus Micrarchaeota archaeon CG10_big_fil_rev_8_21_14_0_10_45_29]QBM01556.1 diaminopimelate decarboxylase [uncultured archaeon]
MTTVRTNTIGCGRGGNGCAASLNNVMQPLQERNGRLSMGSIPIRQLAEQFGVLPKQAISISSAGVLSEGIMGEGAAYIYDGNRIVDNYRKIRDAMSDAQGRFNTRVYFALKSNSNPAIMQLLASEGCGADCANYNEIRIARMAGVPEGRMLYSGNNNPIGEMLGALQIGAAINFDDINLFESLSGRCNGELKQNVVSFRFNPGTGLGENAKITTGGEGSKFGMGEAEIMQAYRAARERGATRFALHMMTGSNTREVEPFVEQVKEQVRLAGRLCNELGITLEFIDIGGGFGIPYLPGDSELDIFELGRQLTQAYAQECGRHNVRNSAGGIPDLMMEPGRYIVGDAGVLAAKVTSVKNSFGRSIIGIDASMSTLMRVAMYDSYHHILIDGREEQNMRPADVVGQACESSDFFAHARLLPQGIRTGDLAVICTAGAYGFSMSSNYCNMAKPAEVLVYDGEAHLIRRRQGFEQMVEGVQMLPLMQEA